MNALDEVMLIVGRRFEYLYCLTCSLSIPNKDAFIHAISIDVGMAYHRTGDGSRHFLVRETETP